MLAENRHFIGSSNVHKCAHFHVFYTIWNILETTLLASIQSELTQLILVLPFSHTGALWNLCSRHFLKTLWQNDRSIIKINFSFYHNVFNSIQQLYFHLEIFNASALMISMWSALICCMLEMFKDTRRNHPYRYSCVFLCTSNYWLRDPTR